MLRFFSGDEFRDFLATTRVEAIAANEQGAGIAAVTVKVTDSTGQLLLWDINDLQLGMRAGWHSPAFMPGWLALPAPPQP